MKKLRVYALIFVLLMSSLNLAARGGHVGGHHGGHSGHHNHGGHARHGQHPVHREPTHHENQRGHHQSRHHADQRHHGYHGYGRNWNPGWGWGYPGWAWGATAAIIAGTFLFGGYTYNQWAQMAQEDPEKSVYFETVVTPAYNQYQNDPASIPVRDSVPTQGD